MTPAEYRFWPIAAVLALLLAACAGQGAGQDLLGAPTTTPTPPSPSPQALSPRSASAFTSPLPTDAPPAATPSAPGPRPTPPLTHRPTSQPWRQPTAAVLPWPGAAGCERLPLGRARSQEEIVALARQWLAERLGVPLDRVEVFGVEEEMWDEPPTCLPSPPAKVPDRAYPGPIPGYRLILSVNGMQYEVRSGGPWLVFWGQIE